MRSFSKNWKKPHCLRPWSSWKTLTIPVNCLRYNTAGCEQSRKFLECIHGEFFMMYEEVLKEPCLFSWRRGGWVGIGSWLWSSFNVMSGFKENKVRVFSAMHNKMLRSNGHVLQQEKLQLHMRKKYFQNGWSNTGADCLEMFWNVHLWKYQNTLDSAWKRWYNFRVRPCFWHCTGPDNL